MAETKTFGVKVPEELHQEATDLQRKLGLSGEGFLNELVRAYKLEKAKEDMPQSAQDLKELQALTQRINNIYINLGYRVENIARTKEIEAQDLLTKKDTVIYDLQVKNKHIEEENQKLKEAYNDLVDQKKDLLQRVNEQTESKNNIKALIEEYKEKNDMLTGLLKQYEKYPKEIETIRDLLANSESKGIEKDNIIRDKEYSISSLNALIGEKDNYINELNNKYKEELHTIKDRADLEKDKSILDLQKEFSIKTEQQQEHIQQIQDSHNKEINEYQAKYKTLLRELEEIKKGNLII